MSMKTRKFSNETLNAVAEALNGLQEQIQQLHVDAKTEPCDEVAQRYLMNALRMTQGEAEEACESIQSGIKEFDAQYKANAENDKVGLRAKLEEVTANMDEQKRADYLGAILTAFQSAKSQDMTAEQVAELQSTNVQRPASELIDDIEAMFNDNVTVGQLANFVDTSIDTDAIINLSRRIATSKDEHRFFTAVILYAEQHEGKIKLPDTAEPLPADLIGSLASASIEAISATGDLKEGKIDLQRWQKILKWILGALTGCALAYLALLALAYVGGSVIMLVLTLFGTGTIAIITSLAVALYVCWDMGKYSYKTIEALLELLSGIYDQYIDPITQKIRGWAVAVQDWFVLMAGKLKGKKDETVNEQKQDEGITEGTVTIAPVLA